MAGNISVEENGLKAGVAVCDTCIHELTSTSQQLMRSYTEAGQDWKDENYAKLGVIVEDCITALKAPIPDIEESKNTINEMLGILTQVKTVF